ncbi:beta-propeller fold lactonase family protein [bacterium]|nr:beta-propeller fold lactonase family protein [bacterium]
MTKEVPQSGVTNNSWDVNSTTENYTRLDSAYDTTLDWVELLGDISTASYASKSFSVTSQATQPSSVVFNNDGTSMFIADSPTASIYQYTLSTAYDVSTASYASKSVSVSSQDSDPREIAFKPDGTILFVVGKTSDAVYQYTLSTAFDLSTASYSSKSTSVASQEVDPTGIFFKPDGTKMYVIGFNTDAVYQYTLSTAWDVSTASYDSVSFSVASQETTSQQVIFTSNGSIMLIIGQGQDTIYQYSLSTPWDISTASYASINFDVASQAATPSSIAMQENNLYVCDLSTDTVYQYLINAEDALALGTGSFASADVGKTIEANSGAFVLTATDGSYVETTAPTSYDQVASGSWEMYGVVYNAADGDLELSGVTDPASLFDVSTASFVQSFSVSAQEGLPRGMTFSSDGTKMFVCGTNNDSVNEYTLSTAFDVSTASFTQNASVSGQETAPEGIAFNTDGTKMFIVGPSGDDVNEYTLSTAFDVSTISFVDSFSVAAQDSQPIDIAFNNDGTKMFIVGLTGRDINEYTLSTGFDVSSASFVDSFGVATQETQPTGVAFNNDGTKMFIVGEAGDDVNEYTLSTGFDVSTASFVDSFSIAAQEGNSSSIRFNNDGSKMFVLGVANDSVNEYSVGSLAIPTGYHPVHTTQSTDTTYWTDINSMTADQAAGDGNVYYAISTDDRTTWTVIDNTDGERDIVRNNGGTWQYNSNATYASETWVNGATNTELATLAEAMEGAASGRSLTNASYDSISVNITANSSSPQGIRLNTDGTKMFVVDIGGSKVNEYALSTAFDTTTATYSQSFSVAAQDTGPQSLAFNTDGTKMFVVGYAGQDVNEYTLSTAFDISTSSFVDSFSVSGQETNPRGIAFNNNGTKMFIVGTIGDDVNEYTLSAGFDVSTASFVDSFSVSAQDTNPYAVDFNADGTKMFVVGTQNDSVYEYTLSSAFDVSTSTYSQAFDLSSQAATPIGITFFGAKMLIVDGIIGTVFQYSVADSYPNQMDKTQLDAVTDPNHIALGNDLDLAIVFNMTSGTTVPSSDGVAINYDATVLNKGAVLGTDYDFDAPAQDKVRITALAGNNLKVRVV